MNQIQTLISKNARNDKSFTFITHADDSETIEVVPYDEMYGDATAFAEVLRSDYGFVSDSKVGIVGSTNKGVVTAIEAVWISGACVSVLPLPFRLNDLDEFVAATKRRIEVVGLDILLLDELAVLFLGDVDFGIPTAAVPDVMAASALIERTVKVEPVDADPDALAILQFTSGSTSEPKAVGVTYRVLYENLKSVAERLGFADEHDKIVLSWLPLYHDMGLVGVLGSAMTRGLPAVLAAPQDFIARPHRWMEWISEHGATITAGPNFAYSLAARELSVSESTIDLSCLEVAINGAEPVVSGAVRDLVDAGARHNMSPGAPFPVFGMAEVGIAVSFPPVGRGLHTEKIDPSVFAEQKMAVLSDADDAKEMVLLGTPLDCLSIKVVDPDTMEEVPDRHVGEVLLSGPSVVPGYYLNDAANAESFHDGWLRTGDLGYRADNDEYVITGRIKDLIVVSGRNVYPQDIELAASGVEGIRTGNVIAFGIHDGKTEHVYVVAESKLAESGHLRRKVKVAVSHSCNVTPHKVMVVPPGTVPKTSSGKVKRGGCRQMFMDGKFDAHV